MTLDAQPCRLYAVEHCVRVDPLPFTDALREEPKCFSLSGTHDDGRRDNVG